MTRSTGPGLTPLLLLALACNPTAGGTGAGLSAADEATVRAVVAASAKAANTGDAGTVSIDAGTPAVEGRGDLAVIVGNYRLNVTPKEAGATPLPTENGKYMQIMRKQADGSWKIAYDMWNADAKP
jgi:hypothetical protein